MPADDYHQVAQEMKFTCCQAGGQVTGPGGLSTAGPAGSASPFPGSSEEQQQWSPRQASQPVSQQASLLITELNITIPALPSPSLTVNSIQCPGGSNEYN